METYTKASTLAGLHKPQVIIPQSKFNKLPNRKVTLTCPPHIDKQHHSLATTSHDAISSWQLTIIHGKVNMRTLEITPF